MENPGEMCGVSENGNGMLGATCMFPQGKRCVFQGILGEMPFAERELCTSLSGNGMGNARGGMATVQLERGNVRRAHNASGASRLIETIPNINGA